MPDSTKPTINDPELSERTHLLATARLIVAHPSQCSIHPGNRRDLQRAAPHIADLAKSIGESGQLEAAVGRPSSNPDQPIELLKGACRHGAVAVLNADGTPTDLWVLMLDDCSDEQAWELITSEQVRIRAWSAWETAEHFDALFEAFGSNKAIHRRLGLDPANIGRTRKVTALPPALLDIITDRHEISARSAVTFMASWSVAKARRRLEIAIAELGRAYPEKLDADAVFAAMTEALREDEAIELAAASEKMAPVASMQQDSPTAVTVDTATAIEQADLRAAPAEAEAAPVITSHDATEDVEATLARDAAADDRRTDIVGEDDTIIGHAIIHNHGGLTLRITRPLTDHVAIGAATAGMYQAMLKLHHIEPHATA
ncbi:hypothetical protein HZF05_13775 [Sphingomonas sp. CGMCC 1.13654]|uniref:Uncharacterized protein n=1 Tax=Sphingomonas chungangi TaxID=2683589 RepID=A0A838L7L0_9SPHN|nr:hypothetical protein [Sphingomonas chungangi]MBA2935154.1 hypothetical protein [Sphingomonas chungangi]MVW57718.1 hypothetical protein [Sphingomonas chungangi]